MKNFPICLDRDTSVPAMADSDAASFTGSKVVIGASSREVRPGLQSDVPEAEEKRVVTMPSESAKTIGFARSVIFDKTLTEKICPSHLAAGVVS